MQKRWIIATIFGLALMVSSLNAQSCKTTDADKTAALNAIHTFFAGAALDDMAKLHRVTTGSFHAFDNGQPYGSIDDLMSAIKGYQNQGFKFVWSITEPEVTMHCDVGWITYVNVGSVQMPNSASPTPTQWLESAVLEKQDGTWKIAFFHSTRVPPPTTAAK